MPPARFATFVNPWFTRKCATRMDRPPAWHMTMVSASFENSPSLAGTSFIGTCTTSGILASCNSHASRTSSTTGLSPRSRRALSSSTDISRTMHPTSLEREALGTPGVFERVDGSLEQSGAVPGVHARARHQHRLLRQARADHDEQTSTHGQRAGEAFVVQGQGSAYGNERIVATHIQVESVTRDHFHLPEAGALEVAARCLRQFGLNLDGAHTGAHRREAGGHVTGAAAYDQAAHPGRSVQCLQEASDDLRRQH